MSQKTLLLKKTLIVFRKETLDNFRDRRSVGAAFLFAIFGPLVAGLALASMAKTTSNDEPLALALSGGEHAPSLVRYLTEKGAVIEEAPDDAQSAVRDGDVDIVLEIPEAYGEDFRHARRAEVRLIYDASIVASSRAEGRLRGLLNTYGSDVADLRLTARGVSPSLSQPLRLSSVDLATAGSRAARVLTIFPIYLLLAAFIGGLNVAIDVTAGERERGSLEALLVHPVPRQALAFGKWLAAVTLNLLVVAATVLVSMKITNLEHFQNLDFPIGLDAVQGLWIFVFLLPLAFLVPGLQMLIAFFAKSFKEAQSYLNLLILVPMLPGMLLTLGTVEPAPWMEKVPVLGQQILMSRLLEGRLLEGTAIPVSAPLLLGVVTVLAGVTCVLITGRLLQHERAVLGH